MNIFYEDSMPYAEGFLSSLGNLHKFSHQTLKADDLVDADVLLVRSTTKVNEALLHKAKGLRFVATATAGTNHVDKAYLASRNIPFFDAGGCNATAVAEYVLSALFAEAEKHELDLNNITLGIVGAGQVGKRLAKIMQTLGMAYKLYDPPLQQAGDPREFTSFEQILSCDVISLHVPLVVEGDHPTLHMFSHKQLSELHHKQVLINACRGEVIDNQAALSLLQQGKKLNLVLDVWESEPDILQHLIPFCDLATAHIAGHTIEGKARGTEFVYRFLCEFLNQEATLTLADFLPVPDQESLLWSTVAEECDGIKRVVRQVYDIRQDDAHFRQKMTGPDAFRYIRKHYGIRREFAAHKVIAGKSNPTKAIYALGFR